MSTVTVKTQGFDVLDQRLRKLPIDVQKRVCRAAASRSAAIIRDEAKKNYKASGIKERTGLTYKAIRVVKRKNQAPNAVRYAAAVNRYGLFIEQGTTPHEIRVHGGAIHHPGTTPHHFLIKAFRANTDRAIKVMKETLQKFIARYGG
jgi:HK97 gp10 family phage protein